MPLYIELAHGVNTCLYPPQIGVQLMAAQGPMSLTHLHPVTPSHTRGPKHLPLVLSQTLPTPNYYPFPYYDHYHPQ